MFIPDACYTSYGSFRFADHPAGKAISLGETPEGKTVRSIALWRTRVGCVRGFTCADSGIGFGYVSRADASGPPVCCAVHCHLVRSHSAFAIVADGFDRASFHGFLAKRLLLRGGRLLKHIGVAAIVAAREISGCGFPAQVAVNALVIAVKLSGHVFRVFIRNVGHRFSFFSCRRKFD